MASRLSRQLGIVAMVVAGASCASAPRVAGTLSPAPPPSSLAEAPTPPLAPDPIGTLLATSQAHFDAGERELRLGHLERARQQFDRSLDVLLESSMGVRAEARIRDQFDRFVERIGAYESAALATGDGFTEKPSDSASIDELLAASAFELETEAAPDPALAAVLRDDLAATHYDVPIPYNERVLQFVGAFQGRLREWFGTALQRGSRYLPMIQSVFAAEGLPADLAYVALVESAFRASAVSRASAKGFWQFMRATGKENGLRHDWYVDERADPEKATRAAAKYLKTLHRMFDGDWHLALASYNGGPGRVQRALKRSGHADFWDLTTTPTFLPRETRDYVPAILAAIVIARNPQQYGFDVSREAPLTYETVAVSRATDLRRIAEWTGATIDEIQALNPELRRWTTPLRTTNYEVKVPVGTATALRTRLESTPASELAALKYHVVRKGESISTIARRYAVRRSDLAEANQVAVRTRLRAGQELLIPQQPATVLAAADRPPRTSTARASARRGAERVSYRVRRGDTLSSIARRHGVSVSDLQAWNGLRHSRITAGDTLTIRR